MTILNAWISSDGRRALIASDSEGVTTTADGSIKRGLTKQIALPAVDAVLGYSGMVGFLSLLCVGVFTRALDFDELLDQLPAIGAIALADFRTWQQAGIVPADAPVSAQRYVAVGFSKSAGRIVGRAFEHDGADGFTAAPIEECFFSPGENHLFNLPRPSSAEAMTRIARAQIRVIEEKAPEMSGGGELVISEITERSILMRRGAPLVRVRPRSQPIAVAA